MQYLGGKSKIRKQISAFLKSIRTPGKPYLEPFVGGGWILGEMDGERVASDSNKALITMYTELQKGWLPPEEITERLYAEYKVHQDTSDPLTAFIAFGCSFGGKWFGGYARQKGYNFAAGGRRALQRQLPLIKGVQFYCQDYRDWRPSGQLIYCDPPYAGTTGYKDSFDHITFWETMRKWSATNTVVVSEYDAPSDFCSVLEIPSKTIMRNAHNEPLYSVEKLFMLIEAPKDDAARNADGTPYGGVSDGIAKTEAPKSASPQVTIENGPAHAMEPEEYEASKDGSE